MTEKVGFCSNEDIEKKIKIVLGQTDYTIDIAQDKLKNHNYDELAVIREYFGIAEKKALPVTSLNQEIYKQIRYKLDGAMKDYNTRKGNN